MKTMQRVGKILDVCEEKNIQSSFQTNYGGLKGRHRLAVDTNDLFMELFMVYFDDEKLEEKLAEIELHLDIISEAKNEEE